MNNIELLAPVGDIESLYAAVQSGADAVYLGGSKFSARAYASNFDIDNMKKAAAYCHLYGVKIYVTINTLIKESELQEALEFAKSLYNMGVDAIIIQDLGLASLLKKYVPELELHASTQMTIHNAEGALFLKELGFKRIVLSRELSLKEIQYISKDLGLETEIFVHGALCVCYSGQCLMSSMIGGRSGNRGRCAQPCRLPYTIIDKRNKAEEKGYILSPKDICTIENIKDIIESGTSSLKIEGRMKRPEYVAGVVRSYRRAIDNILKGKDFRKEENHKASTYSEDYTNFNVEQEKKKLMQLFNREGFSKAYLFGNEGKDMMAYSFPKNTGLELGKVEKNLTIVIKENISLKDGIRNVNSGFAVSKIIKNGVEVEEAFTGDRVKLLPVNYKKGDVLYKTSDWRLLKELGKFHENPYERKINLDIQVKFKVNEPIVVSTLYKNKILKAQGELVQKALKRPLEKERIIENLNKTGDVPFKFNKIEFYEFEDGFLPMSSINEVRRNLIDKIENYIVSKNNGEKDCSEELANRDMGNFFKEEIQGIHKNYFTSTLNKSNYGIPEIIIYISNEEQLKAVLEMGFQCIAINPFGELNFKYLDMLKGKKVFLKLPNIVRSEFQHIYTIVEKNLSYIEGIITANTGVINKFKGKTNIIGDYKLNIFNSSALDFYEGFIIGSCLSVELNKKEIKELVSNAQMPIQVLIYGKVELMVSEYCAVGSIFGGKTSCKNCSKPCERGDFLIKDRKGEEFILKTDKFCRSYIYNSVPTNLIQNINELRNIDIKSFRLDFIDESYEEAKRILNALKEEKWEDSFSDFTRGHYKRGVE